MSEFPSHWTKCLLGERVQFQYGKSPNEVRSPEGKYPVYGSSGKTAQAIDCTTQSPSIIVGRKGTIDKPIFLEEKCWAIDTTFFVDSFPLDEPKYLFYLLDSINLKSLNESTGVPSLSRDALHSIPVALPPLPEQKKIAEILSGIDKDICIHQQKAEDLDILLRELLRDHFQEKCEGSDLRLEKVTRTTIQYGANASASKLRPGEPRYIRITDIKEDGTLNELNAVGIDLPLKDCGNYMLHEGDLLLARTGNTIGKSYLHSKPHEELVFAGYLLRVALDINAYRPEYLFLFTQSDIYKNWISETTRTGAQPNINAKEYGSMLIPSTSIEEQDDFIAIAMSLRSAKCILNNKIDKLKLLKQAISSDLLSGRKRVSV